ncbi:MAG: transposase [Caldilineaceae bacterium SB0662_bin_9]|uniref:Transposase n=1 Tax=Caldilineaceae bacterium SB0662_bin_9 TaxID=2605258 RepID=A0A6B1DRD5_9CHLR|nr:transposase [Caldilineaceae bacterium SB0662_bin_9]
MRRLQYFVADSFWSDQPFLERHRQAVGAELGTREGVFLVDTTDMPMQGVHSVGVARQYCGRPVGRPAARRGCSRPTQGRAEPRGSTSDCFWPGPRLRRSGGNAAGCPRRPRLSAPSRNCPWSC